MTPANRIIFNTLATYGQSVIGLILSLFSARWVLQGLGEVDFGLFGLVGSIIILIGILNCGLSVGVVRFYSIAIGRGEKLSASDAADDLKRWFNTALSIHILLPFLVLSIGWPLGEYAIQHWLTIPPERMDASLWVFRASLATAFMTVVSVPFTAMFQAQQRMVELALFGIAQSIAIFILAWNLHSVDSDRLVAYGIFMMSITVIILLAKMIRAFLVFPACRPTLRELYRRDRLRELFLYSGWKLFGSSCFVLRQQGIPILANLAFGPVVNAAYSVANRISVQASSLSASLTGAFQPALTATEGKGNRQGMLAMAIQICNFGTLLVALFAIPMILEMEGLLTLWLIEPPPHSAAICRWLLAMLIIDRMTLGPPLGISAHGRIAAYEVVQGFLFLLALPFMWLIFRFGHGPEAIGYALFLSNLAYCIGRIIFAKLLIAFPVVTWIRSSFLPLTFAMSASASAGYAASFMIDGHLFRLLATGIASASTLIVIAWYWVFNGTEKRHAANLLTTIAGRFRKLVIPT